MRRRDRRVWAACESLDDLCAATVRWLHGEVRETPGHLGPPDPETATITDDLVALNRAGLLTMGSQPGLDPVVGWGGRLWHQRAYVQGYCSESTAAVIWAACVEPLMHDRPQMLECHLEPVADMRPARWFSWWRPGTDAYTPVTGLVDGTYWSADCPHRLEREYHDDQFGGVGAGAYDAVEASVRATVVDLEWGASRRLWNTLRSALTSTDVAA